MADLTMTSRLIALTNPPRPPQSAESAIDWIVEHGGRLRAWMAGEIICLDEDQARRMVAASRRCPNVYPLEVALFSDWLCFETDISGKGLAYKVTSMWTGQ